MKKILLFAALFFCCGQYLFAQLLPSPAALNVALEKIVSTLPDNCASLYGNQIDGSTTSFESTVSIPGSTSNRFDVNVSKQYPIIFMSYVPAGDDKAKAAAEVKAIGAAMEKMKISYQNKKYNIIYVAEGSKTGDDPDLHYKLVNPPAELANAKLYVRLDDEYGVTSKWKCTMGVYVKTE